MDKYIFLFLLISINSYGYSDRPRCHTSEKDGFHCHNRRGDQSIINKFTISPSIGIQKGYFKGTFDFPNGIPVLGLNSQMSLRTPFQSQKEHTNFFIDPYIKMGISLILFKKDTIFIDNDGEEVNKSTSRYPHLSTGVGIDFHISSKYKIQIGYDFNTPFGQYIYQWLSIGVIIKL